MSLNLYKLLKNISSVTKIQEKYIKTIKNTSAENIESKNREEM